MSSIYGSKFSVFISKPLLKMPLKHRIDNKVCFHTGGHSCVGLCPLPSFTKGSFSLRQIYKYCCKAKAPAVWNNVTRKSLSFSKRILLRFRQGGGLERASVNSLYTPQGGSYCDWHVHVSSKLHLPWHLKVDVPVHTGVESQSGRQTDRPTNGRRLPGGQVRVSSCVYVGGGQTLQATEGIGHTVFTPRALR